MFKKNIISFFLILLITFVYIVIIFFLSSFIPSAQNSYLGLGVIVIVIYSLPVILLFSIMGVVFILYPSGQRLKFVFIFLGIYLGIYFILHLTILDGELIEKPYNYVKKFLPPIIRCNLEIKNFRIDNFEKDKCYLGTAIKKNEIKICKGLQNEIYDHKAAMWFSELPFDSMQRHCFSTIAYNKNNLNICNDYEPINDCKDEFYFFKGQCDNIINVSLKKFCSKYWEIKNCKEKGNYETQYHCRINVAINYEDFKFCQLDGNFYSSTYNSTSNNEENKCLIDISKKFQVEDICQQEKDLWFSDICFHNFAIATKNTKYCDRLQNDYSKNDCKGEIKYK